MGCVLMSFFGKIGKGIRTYRNAKESITNFPEKLIRSYVGSNPKLEMADHIAIYIGYFHHGIYVGNDMVIHFSKDTGIGRVSITSLSEFKQNKVFEKRYSLLRCSRQTAVNKAYSKLGETGYDLIFNNCEHFVVWCRGSDKRDG